MVIVLLSVKLKDGKIEMTQYEDYFNIRIIKALILPSICYFGWISCITYASHFNNIAHVLVFSNAHIFVIAIV